MGAWRERIQKWITSQFVEKKLEFSQSKSSLGPHSQQLPSAEIYSGATARCDVILWERSRILHCTCISWHTVADRFHPAADTNNRYRAQATPAFYHRTTINMASEHILLKKWGQKCQQLKSLPYCTKYRFVYSKHTNIKTMYEDNFNNVWVDCSACVVISLSPEY